MKTAKEIESFVRDAFNLYLLDYMEFFKATDFDTGEDFEVPLVFNDELDRSLLKRAATLLGVSTEALLVADEDAIHKWYDKFEYFDLREAFDRAEDFSYLSEKDDIQRLQIAIWGSRCERTIPTRYDSKDVFRRLLEQLREYDQVLPGTYHPDATLTGRMHVVNFFHFAEIHRLVSSYLELLDRAKELFSKAWKIDLSTEEIFEYNFLVSALGIQDALLHKRYRPQDTVEEIAVQKDYLHYDLLKKLIPVYKQEGLNDFLAIVNIHENHLFEPWKCAEFCADKNLVQRYVDVFPEAKSEMRKFSMAVSQMLCEYSWSDEISDENDKWQHKAYVPKTVDELDGDAVSIDLIKTLSGPPKLGGVTTTRRLSAADESPEEQHTRVMARIIAAYSCGGVLRG